MPLPIKITFLGTSGSTPTKERSLPGVSIEYDGSVYLFDCGEGVQRQLMLYSINPSRIRCIFITHMHGDHVIGVAGLIRTLALNKRTEPLHIYVPEGEQEKLRPLVDFDRAYIPYRIVIVGVKSGRVASGRGFTVSALRLRHSVPTYGYVFKEDGRHRFNKARCIKLGIKGSMFSDLERKGAIMVGKKKVRLEDVSDYAEGRKVAYITDTRPVSGAAMAASGADIMIHEATYADSLKALAKERMHSTAFESAGVANKAKAKKLVIFHMSARYKKPDDLLKDARRAFRNTSVAYDGMVIII